MLKTKIFHQLYLLSASLVIICLCALFLELIWMTSAHARIHLIMLATLVSAIVGFVMARALSTKEDIAED